MKTKKQGLRGSGNTKTERTEGATRNEKKRKRLAVKKYDNETQEEIRREETHTTDCNDCNDVDTRKQIATNERLETIRTRKRFAVNKENQDTIKQSP